MIQIYLHKHTYKHLQIKDVIQIYLYKYYPKIRSLVVVLLTCLTHPGLSMTPCDLLTLSLSYDLEFWPFIIGGVTLLDLGIVSVAQCHIHITILFGFIYLSFKQLIKCYLDNKTTTIFDLQVDGKKLDWSRKCVHTSVHGLTIYWLQHIDKYFK